MHRADNEYRTRRRAIVSTIAAVLVINGIYAATVAAKRTAKLIGVVLPKDVKRGERGSGSAMLYPGAISGVAGFEIVKTTVEIDEDQTRTEALKEITIDGGVQKRSADKGIVVDVPADANSVHLVFSREDQQIAAVDIPIETSGAATIPCGSGETVSGIEQDGTKSSFSTAATYCYAGMAMITGSFNGDSEQTRIDVGGKTARIVGESVRSCYFLLPAGIMPGRNKVSLREGSHVVSFDVMVPRLDLMQVLEESGASAAEAPPTAGAQSSDNPVSPLPLGLGIGVGSMGIGGGGNDQGPSIGVERRRGN